MLPVLGSITSTDFAFGASKTSSALTKTGIINIKQDKNKNTLFN